MLAIAAPLFLVAANTPDPEDWARRAQIAVAAWKTCLVQDTVRYAARSTEPAETVVEAARGSCSTEEIDVEKLVMEMGIAPDDQMQDLWERQRPRLLALVNEARARQAELRKR